MAKLIVYARVSTRLQSTDRQLADLLAADVRPDDPLRRPRIAIGAHGFRRRFRSIKRPRGFGSTERSGTVCAGRRTRIASAL